jgi:hypothetical protein
MNETPWPPALRYRFYRAWNTQMLGLAVALLSPAVQFNTPLALTFFFGGAVVMIDGAAMSRGAMREAGRSMRWRNHTPRLEDWPPLATRRLDAAQPGLRRWADASTAAVLVAAAIGYARSMILT